ncbi:MAG TPA: hypothetical protein VMS74_15435 [Acidimicrobiia bacterium]|nr:hypothetical protein [Acidimicrobiia bacterium]
MSIAATIAVGLIAVVSAFQLGLVAGAPWGAAAWGGTHPGTLPPRLRAASAGSVVILAVMAWILLARDGAVDTSVASGVVAVAAWVVTAYFAFGTVVNAVSPSRVERWWSPVSLIAAIASTIVATS